MRPDLPWRIAEQLLERLAARRTGRISVARRYRAERQIRLDHRATHAMQAPAGHVVYRRHADLITEMSRDRGSRHAGFLREALDRPDGIHAGVKSAQRLADATVGQAREPARS